MEKNRKLGQVVQLGFGSVFGLMVIIAVVSKVSMNMLGQSIGWVTHTYIVKAELNNLEKILVDAETGQRGFLYTGNEEFLEPYNNTLKVLDKNFSETKKEISDNPTQVTKLAKVEELAKGKMSELAETIALKRAGKEDALRALVLSGKGKQLMDDLRVQVAEMTKTEEELLVKRQTDASQAEMFATLTSIGGTVVAISFGILVLMFIARKIVQPINQVANMIASSSTEIAAAVEEQERTVSHQASSVNETTSTMDELSASSRQSAAQSESAADGARQVLVLIDGNGYQGRGETSLRMKVGAIAEQILRLSEQTSQIGNIAGLVSDLANQTNMLSLNAAVEAARAGEHGKGFAVVATEIRKLADQSKQSAEKINALVNDIQTATNSTVMVTDEGTKMVEGIVGAVNNIVTNSQQISLTAKQQAIAIQQVVEAMNALNQGASQTASGLSQTKVSVQKLNEAALDLKSVV